jgi:hypothetical protein
MVACLAVACPWEGRVGHTPAQRQTTPTSMQLHPHSTVLMRGLWLGVGVLMLPPAEGSVGDEEALFIECVADCEASRNCPPPGGGGGGGLRGCWGGMGACAALLRHSVRQLQWRCTDECRYGCMHQRTAERLADPNLPAASARVLQVRIASTTACGARAKAWRTLYYACMHSRTYTHWRG